MRARLFKYYVPDEISTAMLKEAKDGLPQWRLEKANKYKRPIDQFLCAKAYKLLQEALNNVYGIKDDQEFSYTEKGKPELKDRPEIHFNISHCGRCVCCAVSDDQVGVDVEEINQYGPSLAAQVCSEEELQKIAGAKDPVQEFTRLWTMKESALKLSGEGIRDNMKDVLATTPATFDIYTDEKRGYVISVAEPA